MNTDSLFVPQREHAVNMLNSIYLNGVAADLSETGTGKTYVAAWVAKQLNVPLVVICPKVVRKAWGEVLATFGIKANVIINYEKLVRGNTEHLTFKNDNDEYVENYQIHFPKDALVILDETHKCKAIKSKNSNMLVALKQQGYKLFLLSATAATNPIEMRSFGYSTLLHNLYNFKDFLKTSNVSINRFGAFQIDLENTATRTAMRNIHDILFNQTKVAGRMTRKMFGSIFPDNRVKAEAFDMGTNTDKINRVYEMMEAELAALEESSSSYKQHQFAIMTKARRMAELLKVPTMVEMIEDMYDEGISPVVFVNYTETVEAINKKLGQKNKFQNKIAYIVGGQTNKQRDNDIVDFQNNVKRIMIVNTQAGNAGISLHDLNGNFPRHTIISPTWSAVNMLQCLGRAHRAGGKTPVIQNILFAEDTIESQICKRVKSKLENLDSLNDGDLDFSLSLSF
jgi:superfamily II DNA or RNA helicase